MNRKTLCEVFNDESVIAARRSAWPENEGFVYVGLTATDKMVYRRYQNSEITWPYQPTLKDITARDWETVTIVAIPGRESTRRAAWFMLATAMVMLLLVGIGAWLIQYHGDHKHKEPATFGTEGDIHPGSLQSDPEGEAKIGEPLRMRGATQVMGYQRVDDGSTFNIVGGRQIVCDKVNPCWIITPQLREPEAK